MSIKKEWAIFEAIIDFSESFLDPGSEDKEQLMQLLYKYQDVISMSTIAIDLGWTLLVKHADPETRLVTPSLPATWPRLSSCHPVVDQ